MKGIYKISLLIIALFTCNNIFAQATLSEGEQQIKYYLDQVQYWRYQYSPEDSGVNPDANPRDSLLATNNALVRYLITNTSLLRTEFKTLDEAGMKIATSDDKKLRIYSWDTETGNERHVYNAVAQYETNEGIKAETLFDLTAMIAATKNGGTFSSAPPSLYTTIYKVGNNYVTISGGIISATYARKVVSAFAISSNKLTQPNIFAGCGQEANNCSYDYDYFSNYDYKAMRERNLPHMEKGKLYLPEVGDDHKMTGKWDIYEFDGNQFKAK